MSDSKPATILVCGSRNYANGLLLAKILREINEQFGIALLITGGASGADDLAVHWARSFSVSYCVHFAKWDEHGKAAGPIRNATMLNQHKIDRVVAFPGGKGTSDMIAKATAKGICVQRVVDDLWNEEYDQ